MNGKLLLHSSESAQQPNGEESTNSGLEVSTTLESSLDQEDLPLVPLHMQACVVNMVNKS